MSEREMQALIAKLEKQLGMDWREIVTWLRKQNPLDAIAERIEAHSIDVLAEVDTAAASYADDLHAAYIEAGQDSAEWLNGKLDDSLIRFDVQNYRAVARAQQTKLEHVAGLSRESRETIQRILAEGAPRGTNPRVMARDIRDSIGLTSKQSQHVENYRRALDEGRFGRAMRYELRDARSDRKLRRLMRDKSSLSAAEIDALVERFRRNYISFRATTIARTEGLRIAHQGHDDAIQHAIDSGDIDATQLEEVWHSGRGRGKRREQHRAMNNKRVPFGTDFVLPDGTHMRGPGDPRGGAKHNANCACAKSTVISELAAA